jgi:STELLO glycosyltransferases
MLFANTPNSVTDIWRSYMAQPLLWAANVTVGITMAPTVTDIKTTAITAAYSNSTSDMQAEYDLYTKADTLVQLLSSWSSDRDSMHGQMEQLWNNLYERSFIKLEDVELAQLWLQELTASTYRFPCVDAAATAGTSTAAATLSNSTVHSNSAIDKSVHADTSKAEPDDATTVIAVANFTRLNVTGIPPLQGWSIGGGHAVTVPFSNGSAVTAGARTALSNAELCAEQCAVHVNCTAWRYGPQKAPDTDTATAAYDVQCDAKGNGRKRKCRCVLHMPIPAAVAAAAVVDVNRTALQEQHRIIGIRPRAADNAITYSGVVQRDTVVYTGKPPSSSQPLKILVVINFHWHISKGTHKFLLQKVLPLCLPAGFSIVVIGPHADSDVTGVLLNPWTYKGHFSGLSLALAHAKFPDYDGECCTTICIVFTVVVLYCNVYSIL